VDTTRGEFPNCTSQDFSKNFGHYNPIFFENRQNDNLLGVVFKDMKIFIFNKSEKLRMENIFGVL
jgi:hypothetical protein